jgi:uncharacterized protein involved in exopolysaccharide biosynthesis
LIIAAILVFGAAVGALSFVKGGFTSSATLWVEKPIFASAVAQDPSNLSNYVSAATYMSGILDQYLGTNSFKLTIAQKAGIPMRTSAEQDRVLTDLNRSLRVEPAGTNLMRLIYTGEKPTYAMEIISQTVQAFITYQDASRLQQIDYTLQIYEQQLASAEDSLSRSKSALNDYLREHPGASNLSVQDPTYTALDGQYKNDLDQVTTFTNKIDQLKIQKDAPTAVSTNFLRVIDEPTQPEPYKASIKDLLRNVGIAFALALITIVGLTLVATWTDQAVYTLNDISSLALTDVEGNARELLIGMIPYVPALGAMRRRAAKASKDRPVQLAPSGHSAPTVAASTRR